MPETNTPPKSTDLEERLVNFAVYIVKLCNKFPKTHAGQHIVKELLQCGTAPAAHYAEARSAENSRDAIDKLKNGLKDLTKSRIWLKITSESQLVAGDSVQAGLKECDELSRIFNASIKNARKRLNN